MKKVALIGSTGQLGSALLEELGGENVFPFSHQQIEIGDLKTTANVLVDYAPQIIINTAAFHNVLACERDPDQSFLINCTAVKNLAHVAARIGSVFVHVSTDYVFGLKQDRNMPYMETDSPGPVNVYGLSKLAGEYASLYTNNRTFIFRSSGLYGLQGASSKGGNFVDKRILDAETQTEIPMSREQKLTPTFTRPLAKSMVSLIFSKKPDYGIYHASCGGECSWAEFTLAIYELLGKAVNVIPTDRGGVQDGVRKPFYCVLENRRLEQQGQNPMPNWREALIEYLKQKSGA